MATFARIYVGEDGLSHVEEIEPPFGASADPEGALEATPFSRATEVAFRRSPPGHFQDFHTPPVLLVEDLTGRGHTTRVVGSEVRVFMVVALDD